MCDFKVVIVLLLIVVVVVSVDGDGELGALRHVGRITRRSGRLGGTFVTGVARRVHAPLGTVMNFAAVLTRVSGLSERAHVTFLGRVGSGGSSLLRLIGSLLSCSGVRTGALRCGSKRISMGTLVSRIYAARGVHSRPANVRIRFMRQLPRYHLIMSHIHFTRIVNGLIEGTLGFARVNDIGVNYEELDGRGFCFCITSANYNVSRIKERTVFRQFIGVGCGVGNAKLKLSVAGSVIRRCKKNVNIRSGGKRNSAFCFALPTNVRCGRCNGF